MGDNGKLQPEPDVVVPLPLGGFMRPNEKEMADPGSDIPALLLDRTKAPMRCETCQYGGQKPLDWSLNKRVCPMFMWEPDGRCAYQVHHVDIGIDFENPQPRQVFSAYLRTLATLHGQCSLDIQIKQSHGISNYIHQQRLLMKIATDMRDAYFHAVKLGIMKLQLDQQTASSSAGKAVFRVFRELLRTADPAVISDFVEEFSSEATDSAYAKKAMTFFLDRFAQLAEAEPTEAEIGMIVDAVTTPSDTQE